MPPGSGPSPANLSTAAEVWDPAITFAVCLGVLCLFGLLKVSQKLDSLLSGNRYRRGLFLLFSIASVFIFAGLVDALDFSEILDGNFRKRDGRLMSFTVVVIMWHLWSQWELWLHEDRWNIRLDDERKETKRQKGLHEEAQKNRDFLLRVGEIFLNVVGVKAVGVSDALQEGPVTQSEGFDRLKAALSPERQIAHLIMAAWQVYGRNLDAGQSLRIAYYRKNGDYLEPLLSYSGGDSTFDCIKSPLNDNRGKFKVDASNQQECLAVNVANLARLVVIEDAEKADQDPNVPFRFFDSSQRDRIRSIVGVPLTLNKSTKPPVEHIVTLDTTQKGFFTDEQKEQLGIVGENLAHRLLFEKDMQDLLNA